MSFTNQSTAATLAQPDAAIASKRDPSIDIARGLSMYLVVLGHSALLASVSPEINRFIFLFHVPAFFFISGCLVSQRRINLLRAGRRLLLPFFAAALLFGVAKLAWDPIQRPAAMLGGILYGTASTLPSSPLWFLPVLFLALAALRLVRLIVHTDARPVHTIAVLAGLAGLSVGGFHLPPFWCAESLRYPGTSGAIGWPWSVDLVPVALLYCWAGQLTGRMITAQGRLQIWLTLGAGMLLALCFFAGARMDLAGRLMMPQVAAFAAGLGGAVAILGLGRLLAHAGSLGMPFACIGQHSMMILILHVTVQKVVLSVQMNVETTSLSAWGLILVGSLVATAVPLVISLGFSRATRVLANRMVASSE